MIFMFFDFTTDSASIFYPFFQLVGTLHIKTIIVSVVHFEHFIDFCPNPKGNIDEISSSSFRIRGEKLEISPNLIENTSKCTTGL